MATKDNLFSASSYTWGQREMNKSSLFEILIIGVYAKQQSRITWPRRD